MRYHQAVDWRWGHRPNVIERLWSRQHSSLGMGGKHPVVYPLGQVKSQAGIPGGRLITLKNVDTMRFSQSVCVSVCVQMSVCVCMRVCVLCCVVCVCALYVCMHIYIYICTHVHMHACIHECVWCVRHAERERERQRERQIDRQTGGEGEMMIILQYKETPSKRTNACIDVHASVCAYIQFPKCYNSIHV